MDSIACSKRRKEMDAIDRISALPDALVVHILSFLPTIDGIRTTVLSRRWNNQWTSVQNLNFDEGYYHVMTAYRKPAAYSNPDLFATFVNRALLFRDSSDIQMLTLRFDKPSFRLLSCHPHIVDFIRTAVRRNVVALRVIYVGDPIQMPGSVLTSKTLRILSLDFIGGEITFDPSTSCCFPSLESLKVRVKNPVEHEMKKLFSSCPKLVHLSIRFSVWNFSENAAFNLEVFAPELKKLKILSNSPQPQLYVHAPKLEHLFLFCFFLQPTLFLKNAKSLVKASIDLIENEDLVKAQPFFLNRPNMHLLAQISEVKYLSLRAPVLMDRCLPAFGNLTKLKLVDGCFWRLLAVVLQTAPKLEYLELGSRTEGDYECSSNLPEAVPICLSSHLKNIYIWNFKGRKSDMKMVEYLLKNGYHLNKFTIMCCHTYLLDKKEELRKELCMFQKAKSCSIYFDEDVLEGQDA